ncbi:MAG: Inner membrane ABC transporter permease protein YcjP [Alphaproteobacteria bacterium MarineAlpha5_Bin6]|nr:MAG: Inner membrane ABC transporter permease protein YcjP [Alphaproteobacteria bacterium MarineAlpha5_Bin6]
MVGKISRFELIIRYSLLIIFFLFFIFPIYWMVVTSLKDTVDIFSVPPKWFFKISLDNYLYIISDDSGFLKKILNSSIASILNAIFTLMLAFPAAYSMSRYKTGGINLLMWFLSIRMIPPIVGAIPLFIIFSKLGLVDTFIALPILYIVINLPFAIWMIKSFMDEIPKEIDESAYVEGCSTIGVIFKIIIPLIRPGIFATLVFCFIMAWNEFLIAYIFTRKEAITAPVGVARFITERQILWGYITAGATLASILPIVLLVIFQKNLIRGLTLGAVK